MLLKQIPKAALMPEAVYQQLKAAILTGVFRPGQTLRQEDIAKQLGVSRGPLREALPKLEAEGMIVSEPHRGCTVVSLAPAEIVEIFELRAMLEASLAKASARKKDPAAAVRMREIASTMRSLEIGTVESDRQRWFDLNYELHDILLAVAGRRHHLRLLEIVRALAEPYLRMEISLTGSFAQADDEHDGLIEAFVAGDCQTLEKLTREHVQHTAQRIIEALHESKIGKENRGREQSRKVRKPLRPRDRAKRRRG
jgi:DNA-binding GntR family transcriptional regulator